jgi:hypothetical protein
MISKGLNERAEQLVSDAINITSALLMIKHFNAVSQEGDISNITVEPKNLDQVVKDYFHQHDDRMETMVELNEENIANATTVFHETIPRMNCRPLEGKGGVTLEKDWRRANLDAAVEIVRTPGFPMRVFQHRAGKLRRKKYTRKVIKKSKKSKKTYKKVNPKHNKCVF